MTNILCVSASARHEGSVSRQLADEVISHLSAKKDVGDVNVVLRDVAEGLPFVDGAWVGANFTPEKERTDAQKMVLKLSDELIAELKKADILVIGTPIYNFGIPATLKAWVDMICRARFTFKYTENGPVGLLEGKQAVITMASGGTKVGSDIDFASPYLRQAMKFIGITDVTIIAADALSADMDVKIEGAKTQIAQL